MHISIRPYFLIFILLFAGMIGLLFWIRCGPLPPHLLEYSSRTSIEILDRNNLPLYEKLSGEESRSLWLKPDDIPHYMMDATIAAEDKRFFKHPGIDQTAVCRAFIRDISALRFAEGGSTITQQVIKRLLGNRKRSIKNKFLEMLYALRLEHRLTKKEILALYLNLAPYGNQYYGITSASRGYFASSTSSLSLAQCAFLAGLPKAPSGKDPYKNRGKAIARCKWVIKRMYALGLIDKDKYQNALKERLNIVHGDTSFIAPHFVQMATKELSPMHPVKIVTTIDRNLQKKINGIIQSGRNDLKEHGVNNVAVIVIDNNSGDILAWEGSGNYFDSENGGAIDGVTTARQPGSTLKPFTYALGFEKGLSPAAILPDIPSSFPTAEEGILYSPQNYDGHFRGPIRARLALGGSINVPAVWLLSRVGAGNLLGLLRKSGFTTLDKNADFYGFGLTLGDAEVRLKDIAEAYTIFPRGGLYKPAGYILYANLSGGKTFHPPHMEAKRVLSPLSTFWITDILSDSSARSFIFGEGGALDFPFPAAVKTGTSQSYKDNWVIGYTKEVTVGVWAGNFDRTSLRKSSGITGAGPIFHSVMLAAEEAVLGRFPTFMDDPLANPPGNLRRIEICSLSGMRAAKICPSTIDELLPEERIPPYCLWHIKTGNGMNIAVDFPVEYRVWAEKNGFIPEIGLTNNNPKNSNSLHSKPLMIISPQDGSKYLIDPTLRREFQSLPLRAVSPDNRKLDWYVDGSFYASSDGNDSIYWQLKKGSHVFEVREEKGSKISHKIIVH